MLELKRSVSKLKSLTRTSTMSHQPIIAKKCYVLFNGQKLKFNDFNGVSIIQNRFGYRQTLDLNEYQTLNYVAQVFQ